MRPAGARGDWQEHFVKRSGMKKPVPASQNGLWNEVVRGLGNVAGLRGLHLALNSVALERKRGSDGVPVRIHERLDL